jgi:uncharacterized protein YfbU (UPF0304 family)
MISKTERFEMRFDPELLERIDQWRDEQEGYPSRAEAIRRLVEDGLERAKSPTRFQPSGSEKLMIWMLGELLRQNKDYDNMDSVDLIQEVIYGGHHWALEWEMVGIFHKHVDREAALKLVVDTLDMWDAIEWAAESFGEAERDKLVKDVGSWAREPEFEGFDGNNEGEYMGIAKFLVDKLGRWTRFKGRSFNSHSPRVAASRAMLTVFQPIRASLVGRRLSVDEVIAIVKRS